MRKFWTALLVGILIVPLLFQSQAQAAVKFTILIDGVKLSTSQAPVMIQGRVMLPMRAIFEALDAKVTWNQKAQTVTAVKDRTTVILKINSKTATINKQSVKLDVPAKNLKGTTMVPVRFVSESLGEKVGWNSKTKTVSITTSSGGGVTTPDNSLYPVSYVTLRDVGNSGDGRDLQVNFSKSVTESRVGQYRVMVVKSSKSSSFNVSAAQMVPSYNYTVVYPSGSDPSVTLTSGSRDVDGDYIRDNQAYTAYVLAIGKTSNEVVLSSASPAITLTNTNAVESASNVKGNDVNDYNDGRDLSVSFTRAKNESNISNYRVIAVKTKDISRFDLAAAKSLPSQNYTTVSKTNSSNTTLSTTLSSSSRDSSGEYIKNGVAYTLYVLSVSSNENTVASKLSSGSSSITLATGSTTAPVITSVTDVNDYGDGRDLRVSFTKLSNESGIGSYRIFVVKSNDYHNFNLSKANSVSSYNYTQVNKTGNNITHTLSSGARDVDGATIRSGVYYRVFVMAVGTGNNSGNNSLSSVSSDIILNNNTNVGTISNLSVSDVSDNNDGRDLQVSFNRASDEYNISHYRAFVVKSTKVNNFDLNKANNSDYYTQINKTGYNITQTLNSGSRDTDGDYIRNGNSYRVFIMSVGNNSYSNNALSSYSSTITLSNNRNVSAVSITSVNDVNDYGDGRDLRVSFPKVSDESTISHYRAFVVKSSKASSFSLNTANSNNYFTPIYKTGGSISQILNYDSVDTDGAKIRNDVDYHIFILSVGTGNYSGSNALSKPVGIKLSTIRNLNPASILEVKDIGDKNNGSDMQVTFTPSSDYRDISEYRILVVKQASVTSFDLAKANAVQKSEGYTTVTDTGSPITKQLNHTKDVDGDIIRNGTPYQVFVLAIGNSNIGKNALSAPSVAITLEGSPISAPQNLAANFVGTNTDQIEITFSPSESSANLKEYRVMVVLGKKGFGESEANKVETANYHVVKKDQETKLNLSLESKDITGKVIKKDTDYDVYVLAVADGVNASKNVLSDSVSIRITEPYLSASVSTVLLKENNSKIAINFKPAVDERKINSYQISFLPSDKANSYDLKRATTKTKSPLNTYSVKPTLKNENYSVEVELPKKDLFGDDIQEGAGYKVIILTLINKTDKSTEFVAISKPSEPIVLIAKTEKEPEPQTVAPKSK